MSKDPRLNSKKDEELYLFFKTRRRCLSPHPAFYTIGKDKLLPLG